METSQINVVSIITGAINSLFSSLFSSIDNSLYSIIDDLVFLGPNIMKHPGLSNIFGSSQSSGLVLLANSLVIGFLLYYSLTYLLSHFTFAQIQNPFQFIFRMIFCLIFLNSAYYICTQILFFTSAITLAIREIGENLFNTEICFSSLIKNLNAIIYLDGLSFNIFSIDGLLKGFISLGLLNLVLSYALRYVITLVFVLISPFAFISLLLPATTWIFKSWVKIFLSLLLLQIFISLILLITFSINVSNTDIFSKLTYIGSIYALMKANNYLRDFMSGLGTDINMGIANIRALISGN